ncbi:MAG TPA: cbb3-type cytochrome c oxidase subunit 3 [Parvibaculum sp.]|uniref:cbb3-type cytochrome c oxidase subunit 3 n=1 Tax=Parvibaculum sp. TaxID=2024848 RepID=UPI002BD2FC0A|nr:cbb3-type cytochrome c oxidase subunit 3 [Parvibaculum sp.]HMM15130.1 cbb3-type cytochrome c oxidase subunit 3 [Parvibaculum sp.]
MDLDHGTLVAFAKSFGLFYLIAMSLVAVAYAFWPSKQAQFERAANDILDNEDTPCR